MESGYRVPIIQGRFHKSSGQTQAASYTNRTAVVQTRESKDKQMNTSEGLPKMKIDPLPTAPI